MRASSCPGFVLSAGLVLSAVAMAAAVGQARAQPVVDCAKVPIDRDAVPSIALTVDAPVGQAVFQQRADAYPLGAIPGLCLTILSGATRATVAAGRTGDDGDFDLRVPAAGEYVLFASNAGLDTVSVALTVGDGTAATMPRRGLLLRMSEAAQAGQSSASQIRRLDLRREILDMHGVDQGIRKALIAAGMDSIDPEIEARMGEIDAVNTHRLLDIIAEYGWPDLGLVGFDGAEAAFTLLQHAEYAVQKQNYPLVEAAYRARELSGQSYALLTDRILTREDKPQIYGTQARPAPEWNGGVPAYFPIEDEANVDARRAEVGLPPLAEYSKLLQQVYFPDSGSGSAPGLESDPESRSPSTDESVPVSSDDE